MGTLEEKREIQKKSNIGIGVAVLCIGGMMFLGKASPILMLLFSLGAMVAWLVGLCLYAKSKGYSPVVGLIGLLGILGLIILLVLADRWQVADSAPYMPASMGPVPAGPSPSGPVAVSAPMPKADTKAKAMGKRYQW